MLIVTIAREVPIEGKTYADKRDVFRFEAEALDIPAIVRAVLDADVAAKRDDLRVRRLEKLAAEISGRQYCEKGCARSIEHVAAAILTGTPVPACSGHAPA